MQFIKNFATCVKTNPSVPTLNNNQNVLNFPMSVFVEKDPIRKQRAKENTALFLPLIKIHHDRHRLT